MLCLKCVHQMRKSYERGENYFWNKFQPIKSDLSIPFTLPHSPVSPQAAYDCLLHLNYLSHQGLCPEFICFLCNTYTSCV